MTDKTSTHKPGAPMHYGTGLARTGGLAIVIGGVTFTPLWQIGIALGAVLAGGLALRAAHLIRNR